MIPKILHYTWFSGEEFPAEVKMCIDSWKKHLHGWEFRLWDMESLKEIDSEYLSQALKAHKWAFAADFVRIYALVNYGGVYLDTDAMLLDDLSPYLKHRAFIGKEISIHYIGKSNAQYLTSHCMGAEKGHPFMKDCLDYFKERKFIISNNERLPISLRYNMVLLPYIQAEIAKKYGYDPRPLNQIIQNCDKDLIIYPSDYFDVLLKSKNGVVRHLALGSWRNVKSKNKDKITLWYKISWRLRFILDWGLGKIGYKLMKLE